MMTDEVLETLKKARKLLEIGWCQEAEAEDDEGMSVPAGDPSAVRWCLTGALGCASTGSENYQRAIAEVNRVIGPDEVIGPVGNVVVWNDTPDRTDEEVLRLLDSIIESNPDWLREGDPED